MSLDKKIINKNAQTFLRNFKDYEKKNNKYRKFIINKVNRIINNKYMDVLPKKTNILDILEYVDLNLIEQEWNSRDNSLTKIIKKKLNLT